LGRPKQVLAFEGEPLVCRAVRALCRSRCAAVAVVTGAHREATNAALVDFRPTFLANEAWAEGIASSIRTATSWADAGGYDGLLIAVCDQPFLTAEHVDALLGAFRANGQPVGSAYVGVIGVPAVFGRAAFPKLMQLRGDRGASPILREGGSSVPWPAGAADVDTEDALASATKVREGV
jgi:molybdenum cofactor cytidylyltransferase